jgi:hypothetical protein
MKKLILSVTALAACSVGAFAQGTVQFDTHSGAGTISINGQLDTTTDINAELLFSTTGTAGTFSPVAELLLSSGNTSPDGTPGFDPSDVLSAAQDITFLGTGKLQDQSGSSFFPAASLAAGTTVFFEVSGWTGAYDTLAAAQASGVSAYGTSSVFTAVLSGASANPQANLGNMAALNLVSVPEPSTMAMAGVGLASMLLFRRRNK